MKHLLTITPEAGNQGRQNLQQQRIIQLLAKGEEQLTVHEISEKLNISVPTGLKLVNEMLKVEILRIAGKRETDSGRKPFVYSLNEIPLFAVSVEILLKRLTVCILDSKLEVLHKWEDQDFTPQDTPESLDYIIHFIENALKDTPYKAEDSLLGMGVAITGRVDNDGNALDMFHFLEKPLSEHLSEYFDIPVFVQNDTRCFGNAEKIIGLAKNVDNAIIINLSRGLGTCLIVNGQIVKGGDGTAGEFGHMQFGNSDKLCICGKRGCLGGEASGYSLEEKFKEAVRNGGNSILLKYNDIDTIRYDQILGAAKAGDILSIDLVHKIGENLGQALGNISNLLNPERIIVGGKFSSVQEIIGSSIMTGMRKTGLANPHRFCSPEFSSIGELAGIKGAGALVFEHFELI